jgi:hypothetical protein
MTTRALNPIVKPGPKPKKTAEPRAAATDAVETPAIAIAPVPEPRAAATDAVETPAPAIAPAYTAISGGLESTTTDNPQIRRAVVLDYGSDELELRGGPDSLDLIIRQEEEIVWAIKNITGRALQEIKKFLGVTNNG